MKTITLTDFYQKYQTEPLMILDVRAKDDYDARHIPNTQNIPIEELATSLDRLDPDKTYYVMCYSGNRSAMACEILTAEHFEVINVLGGMNAWSGETSSTN